MTRFSHKRKYQAKQYKIKKDTMKKNIASNNIQTLKGHVKMVDGKIYITYENVPEEMKDKLDDTNQLVFDQIISGNCN